MATQGLARTQDQLALRPPKGWTSFFKGEAFDPVADVRCELVQAVIQCLETKEGQATIQSTTWRHGRKRNLVCQIDFVQLSTLVDGLREAVEHQPEVALQCLRVAVSEVGARGRSAPTTQSRLPLPVLSPVLPSPTPAAPPGEAIAHHAEHFQPRRRPELPGGANRGPAYKCHHSGEAHSPTALRPHK